jgi:hypothetical protein
MDYRQKRWSWQLRNGAAEGGLATKLSRPRPNAVYAYLQNLYPLEVTCQNRTALEISLGLVITAFAKMSYDREQINNLKIVCSTIKWRY